jgi:hypothetical protein
MSLTANHELVFYAGIILLAAFFVLSFSKILVNRHFNTKSNIKKNIKYLRLEQITVARDKKLSKIRTKISDEVTTGWTSENYIGKAKKLQVAVGELELASKLRLINSNS